MKEKGSEYVSMGEGAGAKPGSVIQVDGLDNPNLSQEDKDLRLAIALQQQENAAVLDAHKKKQQNVKKAHAMRATRSNAQGNLATIRARDKGVLQVPDEFTTENAYRKADLKNSAPANDDGRGDFDSVEKAAAGTASVMNQIVQEQKADIDSEKYRSRRSGARYAF